MASASFALSETHGIDPSADQALDVVRRGAGESSTPEWLAALNARGDALNRQFGLGDYAAKRDAGGAKVGKRKVMSRSSRLTRREREVLALVAEGLTNAEIGALLWISVGTVRRQKSEPRKQAVCSERRRWRWSQLVSMI
jgi:DNA-binding CsgD family transcriptional regulator